LFRNQQSAIGDQQLTLKELVVRNVALSLLVLALSAASLGAQAPPSAAIAIDVAEIQKVLATITAPQGDQQIRVVDMGRYNLAVGVLHRGKTSDTPGAPINGLVHTQVTETYVILSGAGTLVTGGILANPRAFPADNDVVTTLAGPSNAGPIQNGSMRPVKTGDVIIIPAGVPHGWTNVPDHVDYLSVRPDQDKVLPAGYVHPTLRK
jgi:mannose-6-phosphate isomerase-like protein (cupin superfamily)